MSRKHYFIFLAAFFLLSIPAAMGQGYHRTHPHDFRKWNLGFLMGIHTNMYNLKEQINVIDKGVKLKQITLNNKPGLTLGMITNFKLSDQVSLRIIPSVSLEQRDFDYTFEGVGGSDSTVLRRIEASYFNIPVMIQWKTKFFQKYRIYALSGVQLGLNLASNKKVRDDPNLLKIQSQDISLVFGAGIMLYGDRLKLSPEIKYSFGLTNIYVPEYTSHASAISQLFSQVLTINVNFE